MQLQCNEYTLKRVPGGYSNKNIWIGEGVQRMLNPFAVIINQFGIMANPNDLAECWNGEFWLGVEQMKLPGILEFAHNYIKIYI